MVTHQLPRRTLAPRYQKVIDADCTERGHHEFNLDARRELQNVECITCGAKAIEYLHEGWVHPE